jgi:hypothetical protein
MIGSVSQALHRAVVHEKEPPKAELEPAVPIQGFRRSEAKHLYKDEADYLKKLHDDTFAQMAKYIRERIFAPKFENYGYKVDKVLAEAGEKTFNGQCKYCHAVPGVTVLVTTDHKQLGTDEALCSTPGNRKIDAEWFNKSLLNTKLEGIAKAPDKCAYVAPPLAGIWAAAPYFHNGSVPTLEGVLKSESRPDKWAYAQDGDPGNREFDQVAVGWKVTVFEKVPPKLKARIYDNSVPGFSNKGHTYGDSLSEADRKALIEYLKTL